MDKKDFILQLIEKLSGKYGFATGLDALLRTTELDDKTVDYLFEFLSSKSHEFLQNEQGKTSGALKEIREKENTDKDENLEKELLSLLSVL